MMSFQPENVPAIAKQPNLEEDKWETVNLVETRMLYLSTKSAQCTQLNGDYKSYVSYNLRNYLDFQGDDTIQSISIALTNAILCNSNYQVNENNNVLDISCAGGVYSYVFPQGNYNADTLVAEFNHLVPSDFSVTYDPVSLRFTVTSTDVSFVLMQSSSISAVFGFSGNLASSLTAPYTVTCNRIMNMLPTPCFRVLCDNNNLYFGTVLGKDGSPQYSNVLAHIPNNSQPNQLIYYQTYSDEFSISSSGQTTLILRIVDDNGNLVNFNGVSSYFTFRVRIYKKQRRSKVGFETLVSNASGLANSIREKAEMIERPLDAIWGGYRPPSDPQ